jgi:GT2 family glycosyltransferase
MIVQYEKKLPFDLYTRNFIIKQIIEQIRNSKKLKILDVGGRNGFLTQFFQNDDYFILDTRPVDLDLKDSYINGTAKFIPFIDDSFDIVISSDLYEHIPQNDREIVFDEMFRVSKKFIILGAPFHSPGIEKSEIIINDYYFKLNGEDHPWLKEHIKNGLPQSEEFESILLEKKVSYKKFGSNHLSIWFQIIMLIMYASHHEVPSDSLQKVYEFYNENFSELGDSLEPTYRKIYIIQKFGIIVNIKILPYRKKIDPQKLQILQELIFDAIRSSAEKKDNHIRFLDFENYQKTLENEKYQHDEKNFKIDIQQKNDIITLKQNEIEQITENSVILVEQKNALHQSLVDSQNEIKQITENSVILVEQKNALHQSLVDFQNEIKQITENSVILVEQKNALQQSLVDSQNEIKQITENSVILVEQKNALQQSLVDSQNEIITLSSQIEDIKKSIMWNLLMKFHSRIIERLLPPESKRRNFYELGLKSGRILVNDGFRCLIDEYKKRRAFLKSQKPSDDPYTSQINASVAPDNSCVGQIPEYINNSKKTVTNHTSDVDIIICIHNAYDDVKKCLDSVIRYSSPPFSLILIDDGSEDPTRNYVERFAQIHNATLIRNNFARGYTFAANQGLKASSAHYAILLNSDTIVTYEWLDRITECAESDIKIGIVGPLSNTASWQSVPEIENQGDWAKNILPPEISVQQMGRFIAKSSSRTYPRIPFINGFCLLIKRDLINDVGYFDEDNFGKGYGEENDYCIRAQKAGWEFAIADDVYIYHSQSRSYSDEMRRLLCERSDRLLHQKHGLDIILKGVTACKNNKVLMGIRARTRVLFNRNQILLKGRNQFEGKRLLVLLPICDQGGGAYVIIQECRSMMDMGVDVRLFNLVSYKPFFERNFPELEIPVIYGTIEGLEKLSKHFDAVICTTNGSVSWVGQHSGKNITAYYVQDFEPDFYSPGSDDYKRALESYSKIPDMIRFTKTRWTHDIVKEKTGIECRIIGPSVDIDLFRPLSRYHGIRNNEPVHITAMIRPVTPRRNPVFTLELLREIKQKYQDKVFIQTFGCSLPELSSMRFNRDFPFCHSGVVGRTELVSIFNDADIFLDCSSFQAMGLTAFEAMACGAAVIAPKNGGCNEVIKNEMNGLIVDTLSISSCMDALNHLISDEGFRKNLSEHAITDICEFFPEQAAYNILNVIFGEKYP